MSLFPNDTRTTYGGLAQQLTVYHHVVEIGAGDSHSSQGLSYATHASRVSLIEANVLLHRDLASAAAYLPNVEVHHLAVVGGPNRPLEGQLYHMGYASFLRGAPSFLSLSVEPEGIALWEPLCRGVPTVDMGVLDTGDIDLLILTTGGGEAALLGAMSSRPDVILTKHYIHNARHSEDAQATFIWMGANGYHGQVTARNQHGTMLAISWRRAS